MNMMHGYNFDTWGIGSIIWFPTALIALMVWSLFWKGLALWHSSRRGQVWWFLAILLINSVGIIELIYLFGIAKLKLDQLFVKDAK